MTQGEDHCQEHLLGIRQFGHWPTDGIVQIANTHASYLNVMNCQGRLIIKFYKNSNKYVCQSIFVTWKNNENDDTYFQNILMNLLQFKNEAELQYAKRIDDPDTEHKAEFPELNDEESDVEAIRVEQHQLEDGGEGHEGDLELQDTQTEGLHVGGSLQ